MKNIFFSLPKCLQEESVMEYNKFKEEKSMANKSSKSTKSTTRRSAWGLNKISMYLLCAVAILYVVSMILSLVSQDLAVAVLAIQGVATAIMLCIVAVLAWRYVRPKEMVWKVLYVLCLLLVIVGVIIPMCV